MALPLPRDSGQALNKPGLAGFVVLKLRSPRLMRAVSRKRSCWSGRRNLRLKNRLPERQQTLFARGQLENGAFHQGMHALAIAQCELHERQVIGPGSVA